MYSSSIIWNNNCFSLKIGCEDNQIFPRTISWVVVGVCFFPILLFVLWSCKQFIVKVCVFADLMGKSGIGESRKWGSWEWSLRTWQCISSALGEKLSLLQDWGIILEHTGWGGNSGVLLTDYSPPCLWGRAKSQTNPCGQVEDHEHSQEICLSPRDFNLKMLPFLTKLEIAAFSHQRLAPCRMGNPPSVFMLTNYYSHPFTTDQHQTIPHSWECTLTRRKYRREEEMVTRKPCLKYFNTPWKLTRSIGVWWEDCSLSLPFAKEKKKKGMGGGD